MPQNSETRTDNSESDNLDILGADKDQRIGQRSSRSWDEEGKREGGGGSIAPFTSKVQFEYNMGKRPGKLRLALDGGFGLWPAGTTTVVSQNAHPANLLSSSAPKGDASRSPGQNQLTGPSSLTTIAPTYHYPWRRNMKRYLAAAMTVILVQVVICGIVTAGVVGGQSSRRAPRPPIERIRPPVGDFRPLKNPNLELQEKLRQLGYYSGNIDGQVGPRSWRAWTDFQRAKGLAEFNEPWAGEKTRAAIESALEERQELRNLKQEGIAMVIVEDTSRTPNAPLYKIRKADGDELYHGDRLSELVTKINNYVSEENADRVYLDVSALPIAKRDALKTSINLSSQKYLLFLEHGETSGETRGLLLRKGVTSVERSFIIPVGDQYEGRLSLLTPPGKVVVRIIAKSWEVIESFMTRIESLLRGPGASQPSIAAALPPHPHAGRVSASQPSIAEAIHTPSSLLSLLRPKSASQLSIAEAIHTARLELKQRFKLTDDELTIRIGREFEETEVVHLNEIVGLLNG